MNMQISSKIEKVVISLTVRSIVVSKFLKLFQLRASLKTLKSLIPLKAERAPPEPPLIDGI